MCSRCGRGARTRAHGRAIVIILRHFDVNGTRENTKWPNPGLTVSNTRRKSVTVVPSRPARRVDPLGAGIGVVAGHQAHRGHANCGCESGCDRDRDCGYGCGCGCGCSDRTCHAATASRRSKRRSCLQHNWVEAAMSTAWVVRAANIRSTAGPRRCDRAEAHRREPLRHARCQPARASSTSTSAGEARPGLRAACERRRAASHPLHCCKLLCREAPEQASPSRAGRRRARRQSVRAHRPACTCAI